MVLPLLHCGQAMRSEWWGTWQRTPKLQNAAWGKTQKKQQKKKICNWRSEKHHIPHRLITTVLQNLQPFLVSNNMQKKGKMCSPKNNQQSLFLKNGVLDTKFTPGNPHWMHFFSFLGLGLPV